MKCRMVREMGEVGNVKQRALVLVSLVSILLCASALSAGASSKVSLPKARSLIGTLYFNEAQAYQVSSSAGWKYDYAHNYPGVSTKAAFMKCAATHSDKGFSVTPNLSNIAVVKGWKIPQGIGTHLGGTVPKGVTYLVHETESLPGYTSIKNAAHVTILKGKAYYYNEPCGVASTTTTTVANENAGSSNFSRGYPLPSQVDASLVKLFKSQGRTVTYHTCSYFAPNLGPPPVYDCSFKVDGVWHDNIQGTGHPDGTFSWQDDTSGVTPLN
jgi:hypothetical protein